MPVEPNAAIEITGLSWVPNFAKGFVRDLRVRWALEEAGRPYRERLFDPRTARPETYLKDQPFGQVPSYDDGEVQLFESGAIVLRIAEGCEALSPQDPAGRARVSAWVLAALNSVEPAVGELGNIDIFHAGEEWAVARRPGAVEFVRTRLAKLSGWLGDKDHLEGRFTAGDLMMASVLRDLGHTDIVEDFPNLARYLARCLARPAFRRALDAQLAGFEPASEVA